MAEIYCGKKAVMRSDGAVFESIVEAARHSGMSETTINDLCRGKRKLPRVGYTFRFIELPDRVKPTLCWSCDKACGLCAWSHDGKPVDGWTAEKTVVHSHRVESNSYHVIACPEYQRERRRKSRTRV